MRRGGGWSGDKNCLKVEKNTRKKQPREPFQITFTLFAFQYVDTRRISMCRAVEVYFYQGIIFVIFRKFRQRSILSFFLLYPDCEMRKRCWNVKVCGNSEKFDQPIEQKCPIILNFHSLKRLQKDPLKTKFNPAPFVRWWDDEAKVHESGKWWKTLEFSHDERIKFCLSENIEQKQT